MLPIAHLLLQTSRSTAYSPHRPTGGIVHAVGDLYPSKVLDHMRRVGLDQVRTETGVFDEDPYRHPSDDLDCSGPRFRIATGPRHLAPKPHQGTRHWHVGAAGATIMGLSAPEAC